MSRTLQTKPWRDDLMDGLATGLIAAVMALGLALFIEPLALLAGVLIGDIPWRRGWIDVGLTHVAGWMQSLPPLDHMASALAASQRLLPAQGLARDVCALFGPLFALCLVPGHWFARLFLARYDDAALRVEPAVDFGMPAGPLGGHQLAAWSWLTAWCFEGAGSGQSPRFRPWATPEMERPFAIAVLSGADNACMSHLAEAFSRHMDGSDQLLNRRDRWGRWRLRLSVKLQDCCWWRGRREADVWDCGYLTDDPTTRQPLQRFLPRRSTLLIADGLPPDTLLERISALEARRMEFRCPVRLLIIDTSVPAVLRLAHQAGADSWHGDVHEWLDVPVTDQPVDFRHPVTHRPTDP